MSESSTECPLCWIEAHVGNPVLMRPSFAIPPTYRTPIVRFYFLSIDHILKVVTSNRQVIARLEILRERAEGEEVEKINNIISNIKEINEEIIEMKTSMERRGELPTYEPLRFRYTADLDRRTKTETLITATWRPLRNSYRFLERGKGSLRGLRARLLEVGQTEEARNVEREIDKLTDIEKELHEKQRQIQELKMGNPGTHLRGDCPLCWIEAHSGNPSSPASKDNEKLKYKMAKADYLFGYHPESSKLIWTPPESFLDVVKPPLGWYEPSLKDLREKMKKGVELDPLFVDIEPKYCSIGSHEGRHRAKVAAELGIEEVPVILYCKTRDRGYVKYFECEPCEYVFEKWKWKKEREHT